MVTFLANLLNSGSTVQVSTGTYAWLFPQNVTLLSQTKLIPLVPTASVTGPTSVRPMFWKAKTQNVSLWSKDRFIDQEGAYREDKRWEMQPWNPF